MPPTTSSPMAARLSPFCAIFDITPLMPQAAYADDRRLRLISATSHADYQPLQPAGRFHAVTIDYH